MVGLFSAGSLVMELALSMHMLGVCFISGVKELHHES